ncbi:MAG TPA: hypothetical protein HPP83_11635, partial [Candidatus Hydrogenedentes bacterium]|nr:hypothetical protein [Candidatus Hydrogenedentota bacterium]
MTARWALTSSAKSTTITGKAPVAVTGMSIREIPAKMNSENTRRLTGIALGGMLAVLVVAVFGRAIRHGFIIFDDDIYVTANHSVRAGLSLAGAKWAFTTCHGANWHPLTWLSHMLDCQLFGLNPSGHHLSSVILHVASALLLFVALKRMTGGLWSSVTVATLFALHPLRVESVVWVSERKDILSGLFWML